MTNVYCDKDFPFTYFNLTIEVVSEPNIEFVVSIDFFKIKNKVEDIRKKKNERNCFHLKEKKMSKGHPV